MNLLAMIVVMSLTTTVNRSSRLKLNHAFVVAMLGAIITLSADAQATTLTLATYNIHVGVPMGEEIGQYKSSLTDLDTINAVITQIHPDIAALQEVDCEYGMALPQRRRSFAINQARYLAAQNDFQYVFGSAQDDTHYPSDNGEYLEWGSTDLWRNNLKPHGEVGNAILSRFKLAEEPENIGLPKQDKEERRACIRAVVELSGSKRAIVYATHLQHDSGVTRYRQMKAIIDRIATEQDGALIFVLGDLNHEPDAWETSNPIQLALDHGLFDLTAPAAGSAGFTFPADKPDRRIDFIFCNQPLWVVRRWTVNSTASDHLPVAVTVELPE